MVTPFGVAAATLRVTLEVPATVGLLQGTGALARYGPPTGLLILPAIAGLTWLVNTLGGVWFHRRQTERAAAYLLLGGTLLVQALVWVATVRLLTAGNSPA